MQHLLHRAKWDADAIRDDIRAYVVEWVLDAGTSARWVAGDEVCGDNAHLRTALEHRRTG